MIPFTDKENKYYEDQKKCYICNKKFCYDKNEEKKYSICNLRYKLPREIPIIVHNGSKYDNYCIIKELAEEFKGEFKGLGENTEKYISF